MPFKKIGNDGRNDMGPYKKTQTAALPCLPRRHRSRRAAVDEGVKKSLVYCGSSIAAAIYMKV